LDQCLKAFQGAAYTGFTIVNAFIFLNLGERNVIAEGVYRLMPQGQNTLCYLIDLGQQVGIELFKLIMQLEKLWPFHVPVITTYIHVKNLIVGQQDVKLFGELAGTVLMQTDGVGIAHGGLPVSVK